MKSFIKLSLVAVIATILSSSFVSCQFINPSKYALDQHRKACEEIILNGETCSDQEWEVYKENHTKAIEEINKYKEEYTSEELGEINRLEGKTAKIYFKRGGLKAVEELFEKIKGFVLGGISFLDGVLS